MIYLLLLLFSGAVGLWWWIGASGPVYIVLGVLFVYLWASMGDLILIYRHLCHMVNPADRIKEGRVWAPLTRIGKAVMELLEVARYRLNAVRWALESRGIRELKIDPSALPLQGGVIEGELPEVRWYRDCLMAARASFRAEAIAVVFNHRVEGERGVAREVVSHGVDGRRFRSYLVRFLEPYFERHDTSVFGLRDGIVSTSLLGEFSVYGFRYTLTFPFQHSDSNGDFSGVLWLGYRPQTIPTEVEVERARDLARRFGEELASARRIAELTGAVARAEHVSKERSDFIAQISHDIRSPLSNIRSILSVLKLERASGESAELLSVALNNCDSVGEIVADILDYARHKSGKLEARPENLDLRAAVKQVIEGFGVAARLKGLQLHWVDSHPEEGIFVRADPHHVRRAVTNVVSNALKYTAQGSVTIELRLGTTESMICVSDTGPGIRPEALETIFTPFSKAGTSPSADGVGLGCSVTRILCELNRGSVRARSEVGVGTTFELCFPTAATDVRASAVPVTVVTPRVTHATDNAERAQIKVLVVDDDAECAVTLAQALSRLGFSVHSAISVVDAESIFNFEPPDVVITDSQMPSGGARRLVEFMARKHPATHIGVVSGSTESDDREAIADAVKKCGGAHRWFLKPAAIEELAGWIDSVIAPPQCDQKVAVS